MIDKSKFGIGVFVLVVVMSVMSCQRNNFNEDEATAEILSLHNAQRDHHFNKDSIAFAASLSPHFISVNRAQIDRPTFEENKSRFSQYFTQVDFNKWDDLIEPVIRFSDDGSLAYTVVDKDVIVKFSLGDTTVTDQTHFAWTAIYKNYKDGWKVDCVTSTNEPSRIISKSYGDKTDYLLEGKDLIPEGLAFDLRTKKIYVGSTHHRKILALDSFGVQHDFVPSDYDEIWSPLGLEVDTINNVLWAAMAHANQVMPLRRPRADRDWMTNLSMFDLNTGKLIKKFPVIEERAVLNDLTIASNGDVFVTETVNSKLFRLKNGADSLQIFLEPQGIQFLNGIAFGQDENELFIASANGVLKVDMSTKDWRLLEEQNGVDAKGIDGLSYRSGTLIGHQSSRISIFQLSDDHQSISKSTIFDQGKEFDSSTTGEQGSDEYFYIVNSQIRSALDKQKNVKPQDSLEQVIIRRKPFSK